MWQLTDEELARRAAMGRPDEFEELLRRYRTRVYRVCYRMAGNAEDAEDWAQECFVRAYRQLSRYDSRLPFAPWLLRVTANTCINAAKARTVRSRPVDLELDESALGVAAGPDPAETTLSREQRSEVLGAVEELPAPLRQALVLRVLEELSLRELAGVLDIPLQTAASRVRRALLQLRKRLAPERLEMDR